MLFIVVENFRNQDAKAAYRRFRDMGRVMPDGLSYVGSWTTADLSRCFQLMETSDVTLLQKWVGGWTDLVEFEIVPVVTVKETLEALNLLAGQLESSGDFDLAMDCRESMTALRNG